MEVTTYEPLDPDTLRRFGCPSDPFENPDSPEDIWRGPALTRVEYILDTAVKRRRIVALVGPAGAGKSTLVRRLCARATGDRQLRTVALASLDRARINSAALATAIVRDLTGRSAASLSAEARGELLRTTLADQRTLGVLPVLVIDEAHLLSNTALIAIKQVWDSHLGTQDLAVLLLGQPRLRERLKQDTSIREVAGRTALVEIAPMKAAEAADYLAWRFSRISARAAREVFTSGAVELLAKRAEHPLWLNNLAARAMLTAAAIGDSVVDVAHVGKSEGRA